MGRTVVADGGPAYGAPHSPGPGTGGHWALSVTGRLWQGGLLELWQVLWLLHLGCTRHGVTAGLPADLVSAAL